jgi:hypothetical protein
MRLITISSLATSLATSLAISAASLAAQTPKAPRTKPPKAKFDTGSVAKFFQTETPITVTLTTNVDRLRGDKDPATAPWRWATLTYDASSPDTGRVTVPVRVKTRGIWRLKTCQFPPVRLNFSGAATKHTVFHGLDKPKLVNHCRDDDTYEQYVLQEFQLYRIYHLLTPASHAVRLLRMSYADSASGKVLATRYAFIEEEPEALAARLGATRSKIKGAGPGDLEASQSVLVGLFQYLIGNTDFALSALHNAELIQMSNGDYLPVVYDFDFAGAVNARYATADPRLHLRTVRQRLYRGYCVPNDAYPKSFALFNAKKDSIYALYRDPLGKLLRPGIVDETLQYFDEFYKTIDDPRAAKRDVIDACLGRR